MQLSVFTSFSNWNEITFYLLCIHSSLYYKATESVTSWIKDRTYYNIQTTKKNTNGVSQHTNNKEEHKWRITTYKQQRRTQMTYHNLQTTKKNTHGVSQHKNNKEEHKWRITTYKQQRRTQMTYHNIQTTKKNTNDVSQHKNNK